MFRYIADPEFVYAATLLLPDREDHSSRCTTWYDENGMVGDLYAQYMYWRDSNDLPHIR